MRRFPLFAIFCLFSAIPLRAQSPGHYYFTHYTTESGLISSQVNTVLQDADGYIWTGTSDGLQRFDGTRFKTFRHLENDPASIPSNQVFQLLLDRKKNLWILSAEGRVGIFNTRNFKFREASVSLKHMEILKWAVKRLIEDEFGNIFLLIAGTEVVTWNENENEFSYTHNFFKVPEGKGISDFVQQPGTHKYWMGIQGQGIAIYNHSTRHLNYTGNNADAEKAVAAFEKISIPFHFHFDQHNRVWFQSWRGGIPFVYRYDLGKELLISGEFEFMTTLKTYYETEAFFEQADGTIWIRGMGIFAEFLEKENRFQLISNGYLNERSIVYERINALAEDREKNIWVATSNNGLYRFNPSEQFFLNVTHPNRLTGNKGRGSLMSFVTTRRGTLLAGAWGDGLYQYDKNFNIIPTHIKGIDEKAGLSIWSMCLSRDSNTIWLSAQPGIYAIDQDNRSADFYNPALLQNKTVRQVAEDKQGNLWLGLQNYGVFKWTRSKGKKLSEEGLKRVETIPVSQVNKITVDHRGWIWVAMGSKGVYAIDPVTDSVLLHFSEDGEHAFRLPEPGVTSILDYDDSTFVITTLKNIILYNRVKKRSVPLGSPDLLSGFITSVERDAAGYLWIATTTSLYRVSPKKRIFIRFNRDDGIDNDNFILSASAVLKDGRIALGCTDQFIVFDPSAMRYDKPVPDVKITDFKVMNESLSVDSLLGLQQIKLYPHNNSVVIEFSPLSYSSAHLIKYKLEGLDKTWSVADKNNQAIYPYLPPGKYTFYMKVLGEEGEPGAKVSSVSFRVYPPFWKTWWFFCLLALALGGLLFWYDRERMKRKETILRMRTDIADNLHEQVNTALNNINILSEMARLKADKDPEKSKEYIEQIHTKSHNMMIAMDDMLWSINPGNDNMIKTTDRMREYIDALTKRYAVSIDIDVDKKVTTLELNMKLRHDAFLIFKEGIKNLVTVGAKNCHVYISSEKGTLVFTTQFDTAACDMQQLNNLLHRQDLENRLTAMKASISIEVHKTSSVITLEVPSA